MNNQEENYVGIPFHEALRRMPVDGDGSGDLTILCDLINTGAELVLPDFIKQRYQKEGDIALKLNQQYSNLRVYEQGIIVWLWFDGVAYECAIPVSSVLAFYIEYLPPLAYADGENVVDFNQWRRKKGI